MNFARFSSLVVVAPLLASIGSVACSGSSTTDLTSSQAANETTSASASDSVDDQRFAMLEGMLPALGKAAAADFARSTGTALLEDLQSTECLGPKQADPLYPPVSLGACRFTFKDATGGATTVQAQVSAGIVLPGMPDPTQPNDPVTHQPPPATHTSVTNAEAYNAYVEGGDVPALAPAFPFANQRALAALGRSIAGRWETSSFTDEGDVIGGLDDCNDMGQPAPTFAASEGVKFACYTYYVDDDRYHGELLMGLQTDAHGEAVGIRYISFGGFD